MTGRVLALTLALALSLATSEAEGRAPDRKCRDAIRNGAVAFGTTVSRRLVTCEQEIVRGRLPADTDCRTYRGLADVIAKAQGRIASSITNGCAGKDLLDGLHDVPLANVGWDLTGCPDLGSGLCAGPIASHADVVTCLGCIVDHAVAGIFDVAFHDLAPPDPTAGGVVSCRVAIGKQALRYAQTRRHKLARCWRSKSARGGGGSLCPTNLAERTIAKARARLQTAICKGCAGKGGCDGAGAPSPATIGFPATCPDVTPVGGTSCAGPVTGLGDLAACVACVIDHHVDCADRGAVPNYVHFPAECGTLPPP